MAEYKFIKAAANKCKKINKHKKIIKPKKKFVVFAFCNLVTVVHKFTLLLVLTKIIMPKNLDYFYVQTFFLYMTWHKNYLLYKMVQLLDIINQNINQT